ncbi:MAG: hypothetical protein KatS3mg077_0403 [Candidatus Binatia bacterium]|nr:MAG: hypothetical protein KatS3mg077_0403 [Candidatus Binatia bacterium]
MIGKSEKKAWKRVVSRPKGSGAARKLGALMIGALLVAAPLPWPVRPALAANFVVNSTNDTDDGTCDATHCSLREAINAANATTSADDTITFSVSGTIVLGSTLPIIASASTAGKLTIDGTGQTITISGNNSVRVMRVDSGANLTLQNLTIANGLKTGDIELNDGGAIFNEGGTVTITNSTLSNNRATEFGGAISNIGGGTVTITNSTLSGNRAGRGGAISNASGTVTITNSTISNNRSGRNGGGIGNAGAVTITNSTLSGNSADDGGGIMNFGRVTITESTLSQNTARSGGGIGNDGGTATITNSTISGNSAQDIGGGIWNNQNSTVTVINSTLSGNSAGSRGGGIRNDGTVNLSFVTIVENQATDPDSLGGGLFSGGTATTKVKNSIVGNNTAPTDPNCTDGGTFTATGVNLATDAATQSCGTNFTYVPSTGAGGLNLGPLQNNGGSTETHALLSGSAAIDAVTDCTDVDDNSVSEDQRGVARPQDGDGDSTALCDVGAYESGPLAALSPTPTLSPTGTPTLTATFSPSVSPTSTPTFSPTVSPTPTPSATPTPTPTLTLTPTPADLDGDGVPDVVEDAGPNGGDGNGDGTADRRQANVASLPGASGGGYQTMVTDVSCPIRKLMAVRLAPAGFHLPFGALAFELPGCESGRVTIYYHATDSLASPPFAYVKVGPNPPGAANNAVYTLSADAPHNVVFGSADLGFDTAVGFAAFTLSDGVVGDDTGDDGTIVDQGGPGLANAAAVPVGAGWGFLGSVIVLVAVAWWYLGRHRRAGLVSPG